MKELLPSRALGLVAACWVLSLVLLTPRPLYAQAAPLGIDGLDGGRFVGSARVAPKGETLRYWRGAADFGYGHTGNVLNDKDHHERLFGDVAAAWAQLAWLQLALKFDGRYDIHKNPSDTGFAGSTTFATRHAFALSEKLSLAAQTRFLFPAASTTTRGFRGVTPELAGLLSYAPWRGGELTAMAGYRFDRSSKALSHPDQLSEADRLGASVSKYDQVLLGALASTQLSNVTLLGEWSWDLNVGGNGKLSPGQSPMRLRGAIQTLVGERFIPGAEIGVTLSSRPSYNSAASNDLVRIEPRVWVAATLGILLGKKPTPPPTEANDDAPRPAPVKRAAKGELVVLVSDSSAPIAGAAVTVTMGAETLSSESDASGRARFRVRRGEELRVSVTAQGCKPTDDSTLVLEDPSMELPITLERALPEGEIKGKVRSLRGGPLKAKIEILNTGAVLETAEDGTFLVDVPPGDYRLRISADGHEPQERNAQVERLGVTILVVDLRRTPK